MPADDLGTVGLLDETSVVKKGKKTPGVQRQYCGAVGKQENCTVSVHLGVARGGYKALLDADLFLPQSWSKDRPRCQEAGIPDDVVYQPKWRLGLEQIYRAMGNGIVLDWLTFDEGYGCRPAFLAELDVLAELRWLGEVPKSFRCLTARPRGKKPRKGWTGKRADRLARYSPAFWDQAWRRVTLKRQTLSEQVWEAKAAQVRPDTERPGDGPDVLADRGAEPGDGGGQVLRLQRAVRHAAGTPASARLHALERGTRLPGGQKRDRFWPL